jgi:NAD(P) transhydrogenase subunit alpha
VQIAPPDVAPPAVIRVLAIVSIILATINMFGGFAVTRRMLEMFRK